MEVLAARGRVWPKKLMINMSGADGNVCIDGLLFLQVKKGEVKFDPADWSDVSSDAIEFIKLMLTYDPRSPACIFSELLRPGCACASCVKDKGQVPRRC